MYDVGTGQKKKENKHGRMMRRRKEGRKRKEGEAERDRRAEDLLRVFPPWVEGTAGPVLAVCRLAGSIVTLGRRGRAARGRLKGDRKVRRTKIPQQL